MFTKYPKAALALILTALLLTAPASAQNVEEHCAADIAELCPQVSPGDGRIAACLYAHTDLISDECYAATSQVGLILERFFDRLASTYEICAEEIQAHCSAAVELGMGIGLCLLANQSQVNEQCIQSVSRFQQALMPQ